MANTSTRRDTDIAARRRDVALRYLKGDTQHEIAQAVGVNQSTISRDLKALREEWLAAAVEAVAQAKGRELARIDALEREYWAAWQRSMEPQREQTQKAVEGGLQGRKEQSKVVKERVGDARYLAGVQWCIDQRCKILGLFAPNKVAGPEEDGAFLIRLDI